MAIIKHNGTKWIIAWVYVDDMGIISNDNAYKAEFLKELGGAFESSDKGKLQYYLGMNVQFGRLACGRTGARCAGGR